MGSDHFAGAFLAAHCRLVATNVKEAIIKDSGHWVVQEQTAQVQKALLDFFLE
jgi:pimeloyl-ACP methyl ester carboxylesterase